MIKSLRYSNLLVDTKGNTTGAKKDLRKLHVQSSAIKRCITSAKKFLKGFLSKSFPQELINVTPESQDEMLALPGKVCDNAMSVFNLSLYDPEYSRVIDLRSGNGRQLIAYIESQTGQTIDSANNIDAIDDTLSVQLDNLLKLPAWAESIFDQYLHPLAVIVFQKVGSSKYMVIRSGVLIKDIVTRLAGFKEGFREQNVLFYSAHDDTIAGLGYILGVSDQLYPYAEYGAMLCIELHETSNCPQDLEVKIFYFRGFASKTPQQLFIPGCKHSCCFNKFQDLVRPKFVYDYDKACSQ